MYMKKKQIDKIVFNTINDYLTMNDIAIGSELTKDTALIGSTRILDSMGLVNVMVDIETAFLDADTEISIMSETAMSCRISPFRSIGSLCNFIARQLGVEEE
jgi:acyl carrier protein